MPVMSRTVELNHGPALEAQYLSTDSNFCSIPDTLA